MPIPPLLVRRFRARVRALHGCGGGGGGVAGAKTAHEFFVSAYGVEPMEVTGRWSRATGTAPYMHPETGGEDQVAQGFS